MMPVSGHRPQSLAAKLVARASARQYVEVGEVVTCEVDLAMFHDSSGPRRLKPMLESLGATLWDKHRVVLVIDHYVPERDESARQIVSLAREWARDQKLPHVYDSQGICHVVLPRQGHVLPGMFAVGGDSHSTTAGAFGAYMFGVGATEMLGVVVTGKIWLQVPRSLAMRWSGQLTPGVCAKDMMLSMIGRFGLNGAQYQAVEFCGQTVRSLPMAERMTLCNMSAELGAQAGLVAPDEVTRQWLMQTPAANTVQNMDWAMWRSDEGSHDQEYEFDSNALAPQLAAPFSPAQSASLADHRNTRIHVAYIGACTGAKVDDLRQAASILRGKRVAQGVRLLVAPASIADRQEAVADGSWQILESAGATFLPNTCGACAGYGDSLEAHQTVISSTARNFKGRMAPPSTQVFLGSAYTVAASALRGLISDPREILA